MATVKVDAKILPKVHQLRMNEMLEFLMRLKTGNWRIPPEPEWWVKLEQFNVSLKEVISANKAK